MKIINHKKILLLNLAAVLVTTYLFPLSAKAVGSASMSVSPATSSTSVGNDVSFSVAVSGGGASINGFQATISYPASQFSYVSASAGTFGFGFNASPGSGTIDLYGAATGGVSSGTAAIITLHANAAGSGNVSLSAICAGDSGNGCSAVTDASSHHNILGSVAGGNLSATAPPPNGSGSSSSGPTIKKSTIGAPKNAPSAPTAQQQTTASIFAISKVTASVLDDTHVTLTWNSNQPASSIVRIGLSPNKYLFTITDAINTTQHKVTLDNTYISKGYLYYYVVSSRDSNGKTVSSNESTFQTPGFRVEVTVKDPSGKPVIRAKVRLSDKTAFTNLRGQVVFNNVLAGIKTVRIDQGNHHTNAQVSVGEYDPGTKSYVPQKFTLTASRSPQVPLWPFLILLLVALSVAGYLVLPNSANPLRKLLDKSSRPTSTDYL